MSVEWGGEGVPAARSEEIRSNRVASPSVRGQRGACSGLTVGGNGPMKKLQGEETLWVLDGQAGVLGSEDFSPGNVEGRRVIGSKEF